MGTKNNVFLTKGLPRRRFLELSKTDVSKDPPEGPTVDQKVLKKCEAIWACLGFISMSVSGSLALPQQSLPIGKRRATGEYYATDRLGYNTLCAVCWTPFMRQKTVIFLTHVVEKPGLLSVSILLALVSLSPMRAFPLLLKELNRGIETQRTSLGVCRSD